MTTERVRLGTRCVHAGDSPDVHGAAHAPLHDHSTFTFPDTESLLAVVDGRVDGSLYTRYGQNPSLRAVEAKLAAIEGGERAAVFGSGMAALSASFLALAAPGDHVLCLGEIYGGTFELLGGELAALGIETSFLPGAEVERLPDAIEARTRVVFLEVPSNPTLEVLDVAEVALAARARGAATVVDSTFATPVNLRPLELGADLVVHSATKYLGGHSDLTGGVVIGSGGRLEPVLRWRRNLGQVMAPQVAHLLARSLRTLAVRVRHQNLSAATLAQRLASHPRVARVHYPGHPDSPGHAVALRQMDGFGGMLSLVLRDDARGTTAFLDRLRLFAIAPSLGGVESLAMQPAALSHRDMPAAERARRGIGDGLVRLSIGLEDADDLWSDLEQALA